MTRVAFYIFCLSIGMTWVSLPLGLKAPHAASIFLVVTVLFSRKYRSVIKPIIHNKKDLLSVATVFAVWLSACTFNADTAWAILDVAKFFFGFIFSVCAAAVIVEAHKTRSLSYPAGGALAVLGLVITIEVYFGVKIGSFLSTLLLAIKQNDPNIVTFQLFGSSGELSRDGGEAIRGLRHTLSAGLVVAFFLSASQFRERPLLSTISGALLISVVVMFQSRSAWIALAIGGLAYAVLFLRNGNIKRRYLPITVVTLIGLVVGLITVAPLLATRLDDAQSLSGRINYVYNAVALIYEHPFVPATRDLILESPHNFVLDAGLSGGVIGAVVGLVLLLIILSDIFKEVVAGHVMALAGFMLVIRFLTAGSGLPGITEFLGLGAVFASAIIRREAGKRNLALRSEKIKGGSYVHWPAKT